MSTEFVKRPAEGGLSGAELEVAIAAIRLSVKVAETMVDIAHEHAATRAFIARADVLVELLEVDAAAVWQTTEPIIRYLIAAPGLNADERRDLIGLIRVLSEPSVRARANAIQELARKV